MSTRLCNAASIKQRTCTCRFRESADPFSQNGAFLTVVAQWICSLASTSPHVGASPPPNGGICTTRGSDTPATRPQRASCSAKPPLLRACRRHVTCITWPRCRYARKNSPNTAPPAALPRKNSPSKPKIAKIGVFSARWANFFALAPTSGRAGRTFSRTWRSDLAALKPTAPLQPLMQATVKPLSPLLTPKHRLLKPTTPLQPKNALKTPISHP